MTSRSIKQKLVSQYAVSNLMVVLVAAISYSVVDIIGYRSVALLLLATVSVLSIFYSMYPILMAATLSALVWDFFFIPPHFTFHVGSSEDVLLLLMYFVVALVNGVLSSKVREFEKEEFQKEERQNTIKLYKTLFDSISHELRTPIATIVGASDNLLEKNSHVSEADKNNLIGEISIAAFRLNRLIDNLLNVQRLESGMMKIKPDWCDINELIGSPLNRLKDELASHRVTVTIQEDFPIVKLDFGLIEQALFNILHNETLYTDPETDIFINAWYEQGVMTISVSDFGKGFTQEELDRLFSKFYRSSVKTTGGTGLGLSIVKGFVEAHNGTVKVENNLPHGAKFSLMIPAESLVLNDLMDFTDFAVRKNMKHETLSETYIPHADTEHVEPGTSIFAPKE